MQWSLILSSWKNGKAVVSISYFSPFFESHNSSSKKPVVPPGSDLKEMAGSRCPRGWAEEHCQGHQGRPPDQSSMGHGEGQEARFLRKWSRKPGTELMPPMHSTISLGKIRFISKKTSNHKTYGSEDAKMAGHPPRLTPVQM